MSKSRKRVEAALTAAGMPIEVLEMQGETRTAQQAADQVGCHLDQIAKSIIFKGTKSGAAVLFLTAGGNQVDTELAAKVSGESLERADASFVRAMTGFAIGGVSPVGHLNPPHCYIDPRLADFDLVYAAAGTPRHLFAVDPRFLLQITGAKSAQFCR